jgi:hypothetical protein
MPIQLFIDKQHNHRRFNTMSNESTPGGKTPEELKAAREAQKRLMWIENVKRVQGYSQEQAERIWAKIYNSKP